MGAFFSLDVRNNSDFRTVSLSKLVTQLRSTCKACGQVRDHYPHLESAYRMRRCWLGIAALSLASGRLYASSLDLVQDNRMRCIGELLLASVEGVSSRLLRGVLTISAGRMPRALDRSAIRSVTAILKIMERTAGRLDQLAETMESSQRAWLRLEIHARGVEAEPVIAQAQEELLWACPNRISALILLSTLRDNNTGAYRHPALSRKFAPEKVNSALARLHRQTCEELLTYSLPELVNELDVYAHQTHAGEMSLLRNWISVRAYRTVRPADLDVFTSSLFEVTLDIAVAALEARYR